MRSSVRMRGPSPPFIDTWRGGVHVRGDLESSSPPRIGGAQWMTIVESTLWCSGGHGAGCGSCPVRRPWSCGDRTGVLMAPVGVVAVAVEGTDLQAWRGGAPRVLQAGVLLRSRLGPHSRVAPMPIEGSVAEEVRGVGSTVAGVAPGTSARDAAGSHSVDTVLGMAEQ